MAVNRKRSAYPILDGNSITSATRIDIVDSSDNYTTLYGDLTGVEGTRGLLFKIYTDLSATYTQPTAYVPSSQNYVNLGAAATYRYIEIKYIIERGTKYRGGTIIVVHDGSTAYANDSCQSTEEDNSYAIIKTDIAISSQIQIRIDCDGSDANNTKFRYRIVEKITVAT